jgi:2-succinyl-5-enolpyruvyl-6-hydroxy-3-cyclohexene-1-carboxylate synthase
MLARQSSRISILQPREMTISSDEENRRNQPSQWEDDDMDSATNGGGYSTVQQSSQLGRRRLLPGLASAHGVYSPYDILFPEALANHNKSKNQNQYPESSLHSSLQLLRQALTVIAAGDCSLFPPLTRNIMKRKTNGDTTTTASATSASPTIIRIEVDVSHDVDPLCWLQAQDNRQKVQPPDKEHHPLVYFATAEKTLDVATFGSIAMHKGTSEDDEFWKLVEALPDSTHLYGGQRFDTESIPSDEWKSFGQGFWILPAVELRRQPLSTRRQQLLLLQSSFDNPLLDGDDNMYDAMKTSIAVHLIQPNHCMDDDDDDDDDNDARASQVFAKSAEYVLRVLDQVTDATTSKTPPTTLPPVLSRGSTYGPNLDGQELYERGVTKAIQVFQQGESNNLPPNGNGSAYQHLDKVVLARRMDLAFSDYARVSALDVLRKWKFGSQPGGHLFYINPAVGEGDLSEFFGCTPERLFRLDQSQVLSEALAGTRPRGSTQQADEDLARELFESEKDQAENQITGIFIRAIFDEMRDRGWLVRKLNKIPNSIANAGSDGAGGSNGFLQNNGDSGGRYFVRRLRHLQHICRQFRGQLKSPEFTMDVTKYLLSTLHPTPAMGGFPKENAANFIRTYESIGFDRGFYSGPVGYVGRNNAEIVVGIRSGLVTSSSQTSGRQKKSPRVSVYAGAGLVPGSTVQGEWAETSYKLAVVTSIFPQSPITLQSASSPNVAWATAFVEELIRNGVTQFYICPGSRSTPLVAAVARAARSNVGIVHAVSIHDERGAGFRAVGYGRGASRPAAVITSSGTAVANLYPAVVEAGMDGVPLLLLTADRPYESRDSGANQAIDQVKVFSSSYIRWFRDILPPNDDVPVAVALADAAHSVRMTRKLRGPVHINIQFRENLAPEGGPIRNDDRVGSTTMYDGLRFTEVPGFQRWSVGGGQWLSSYTSSAAFVATNAAADIANLISQSSRGLIVVGNLRTPTDESQMEDVSSVGQLISDFAQSIGFPIVASVQGGSLRFNSPAVIPFAEHVLKHPLVQEHLKPDLVLQFGAPLVSTALPKVIVSTMSETPLCHVLIHPHHPHERADPEFTVTHQVDCDILPFLKALSKHLSSNSGAKSSQLAPLIKLGQMLRSKMPDIVKEASKAVLPDQDANQVMTEPEVILSMSRTISDHDAPECSLFLSNSMPVRDADSFLYPLTGGAISGRLSLRDIGVNRGASGIDGIIASATGYAESTDRPTTLLIGDVAALHDINSLHALRASMTSRELKTQKPRPLTTVVLNNDGGGIFSFLPIAKYGSDVSFDEFFGTPTSTFSFSKAAEAFGIPFRRVSNERSFLQAYDRALRSREPSIVEVVVAPRNVNVAVHREIDRRASKFIDALFGNDPKTTDIEKLPIKVFAHDSVGDCSPNGGDNLKTLVLLHGWMGDKSEWDDVGANLVHSLPSNWSILAIDLPGHGQSKLRHSSDAQIIREALQLPRQDDDSKELSMLSMDQMARAVLETLHAHHGVHKIDAIAGYSLGGRVALAMQRLRKIDSSPAAMLLDDSTKLILLGAYPGDFAFPGQVGADKLRENALRMEKDDRLSREIKDIHARACLRYSNQVESAIVWSGLLQRWYQAPLWGRLTEKFPQYQNMMDKRITSMSTRGPDLAEALRQNSPPRCRDNDWQSAVPSNTLYIAGSLDSKYASIGKQWSSAVRGFQSIAIPNAGHALLVDAPAAVSETLTNFLLSTERVRSLPPSTTFSVPSMDLSGQSLGLPRPKENAIFKQDDLCSLEFTDKIGQLNSEVFSIDWVENKRNEGIVGIGWGRNAKAVETNRQARRSGLIVQILSFDGSKVGVGEVSPLPGVHKESFEEARAQLGIVAARLLELNPDDAPFFDASMLLLLEGEMTRFMGSLSDILGIEVLLPSVRSGLEMALLSLASQVVRSPIHQALTECSIEISQASRSNVMLPVNGLITREGELVKTAYGVKGREGSKTYPSVKVKVGHGEIGQDVLAISQVYQMQQASGMLRADANRSWSYSNAVNFAAELVERNPMALQRLEYIEEPLEQQISNVAGNVWSLADQVDALERWYKSTAIPYALDESMADLAQMHDHDFDAMRRDIRGAFPSYRGCAALVLKPTVLGLELSLRLARFARKELGIGAVFTSTFDSGVGLSYISFLASVSDMSPTSAGVKAYPHGVGTFSLLSEDSLSPPFGSYVNEKGLLNVASLSRALYGLGLDEIRDFSISPPAAILVDGETDGLLTGYAAVKPDASTTSRKDFEASIATSSSGREIRIVASLHLPFSADIACSRFTDLPQQPRWSPWISSVAYLDAGSETEWTLRIRGVNFRWRATSTLLNAPLKGIQWTSVSGLRNTGVVEFVAKGDHSSLMTVRMTVIAPRILSSLFKGTAGFFDDFLRNKLIKWSLEMFRDVVKGDLALEEGDVQLGDALFGAVEGKATAIEATLSYPME